MNNNIDSNDNYKSKSQNISPTYNILNNIESPQEENNYDREFDSNNISENLNNDNLKLLNDTNNDNNNDNSNNNSINNI